jgi:hypothetical protein
MQATHSIHHILLIYFVLYLVKDINYEVLHCIIFFLSPVIYSVRFKHIPQNYIFKHLHFMFFGAEDQVSDPY